MYTSQRVARNNKLPTTSATNSRSRTTTQQLPKTQIAFSTNNRIRIATEPWTTQELQQGHGELREFFKQARSRKLSLQNQLEQEYSQLMKQKHGDGWTLDSHKSLSTTSTKTRQVLPKLEEGTDTTSNQSYGSTLKDYAIHKTSSLFINFEEPLVKAAILDNSKAEINTQQKLQRQTIRACIIEPIIGISALTNAIKVDTNPIIESKVEASIILKEIIPIMIKYPKPLDTSSKLPLIPVKKEDVEELEPKGFLKRLVHRKSKQEVKADINKPLPLSETNVALKIITKSKSIADQQLLSKLQQNDKKTRQLMIIRPALLVVDILALTGWTFMRRYVQRKQKLVCHSMSKNNVLEKIAVRLLNQKPTTQRRLRLILINFERSVFQILQDQTTKNESDSSEKC